MKIIRPREHSLPELPEVETVKRQLDPILAGRTIARVNVPDPLVTAPASPRSFQNALRGQRITRVSRRAKYLRLELDSGLTLVIHLRMTGRLTHTLTSYASMPRRHLRLFLQLDDGSGVAFHDQRRFGTATIMDPGDAAVLWRRLGPEPLERSFNPAAMQAMLQNRKRPIKSLLLDQARVAGIGNIYADESLYRANIHPERAARHVTEEEAVLLVRAIKETLRSAISLEGSSIDTYRTATGESGRFQETFKVHRRAGEACPACGSTIKKIKVGGRGTYFCPSCQR
ncbi:MAG: bifunctional DNA-formamidopyrimidine glycosylase/DNA-(apurinic or apyrimidinic site) lyase [Thermoleophilia bacterium]